MLRLTSQGRVSHLREKKPDARKYELREQKEVVGGLVLDFVKHVIVDIHSQKVLLLIARSWLR